MHIRKSLRSLFGFAALLLGARPSPVQAATIRVPLQKPTIQAGIDAAKSGDTVLVANGTYKGAANKNLDFAGKAISVISQSNDPTQCIIDCENGGRGFSFHSGETTAALVRGFTIRNGNVGKYFDNTFDRYGGAIICAYSSPTIANCILRDSVAYTGGGLEVYGGSPIVTSCAFIGNNARLGGGMNTDFSGSSITNCLFVNNSADSEGGGLASDQSSLTLTNCTFYGNTAGSQGGGINTFSDSPVVTNCIIWGNTAKYGNGIGGNQYATVSYSDVQGGYPGTSSLSAAPLFVDAANGDFHLQTLSPCINVGNSAVVTSPPFLKDRVGNIIDLDGNLRVIGKAIDLGAYESDVITRPPVAAAGTDQTVTAAHSGNPANDTATVTLDGSASYDPDGGTIVSYLWNAVNGSVGYRSTVAKPTFTLPVGTYTFTLTVKNNSGVSSSDTVIVSVLPAPNRAPVANAGADQTVTTTDMSASVTLDGSKSSDPDTDANGRHDPLTYAWTEGTTLLATGPTPTVTLSSGVHTLTLTVTDPYGATGTDDVIITVNRINVAPLLNTIADQSVIVGQTLTFTPTLAQSGNNPPFTYSLVGAPTGVSINPATGQVSWTPTVAGTYALSVKVTDAANLSDTKPVNVTVNSDPNGTTRMFVTDFVTARINANTVTVTFSLTNAGTGALTNVQITRGKLGATNAQTPLPGPFTIGAGNKQTVTLTFTSASAIASGSQMFLMSGTYQNSKGAGLSFSTGFNLAVP